MHEKESAFLLPGRLTHDSLFVDPTRDRTSLLKLRTRVDGAFICQGGGWFKYLSVVEVNAGGIAITIQLHGKNGDEEACHQDMEEEQEGADDQEEEYYAA
ncbi:unnamed protein product [Vicia faba]|uniref:Uncharacterized protein n=1 Tax=Vicia faba TaxID=3906 RepID=A0AAV0YMZ6_VICFA|nr:unnamed protein product [Vicia faba]